MTSKDVNYSFQDIRLMSSGYGVLVSLRTLARTMAMPAKVGVYISVPLVLEIAQKLGVPAMPRNERQWFFEETLKAAFDAEKLGEFLRLLKEAVAKEVESVKALMSTYPRTKELLQWSVDRAEEFVKKVDEVLAVYERFLKLKEEYGKPG
ncbi:hypothetical protein [Pyrobaculum sp.]|uniref:hypothetical protein n=1 Tax=Pyrobaculum sp. TaxID=2004705 RepID=UPI00316D2ACF